MTESAPSGPAPAPSEGPPTRTPLTRTPLTRNPWAIALVVGIATITLMRPCTRYVPDPPPDLGTAPAFDLIDADGVALGSGDLRGDVYVVAFFSVDCRGDDCNRILPALRDLEVKTADADPRFPILAVNVDWDKPADALDRWVEKNTYGLARTRILRGTEAETTSMLDGLAPMNKHTLKGPWDLGLVLVDAKGQCRGFYGTAKEHGVDEVAHRAIHARRVD